MSEYISKEKVYEYVRGELEQYDGDFSDISADDVAEHFNVPVNAVNSCIGHLITDGLIYTNRWDDGQTTIHIPDRSAE